MAMANDSWESSTAYEYFMGRWSRLVARRFLELLDRPPNDRWLDVGCGTGVLSRLIGVTAAPKKVTGVDFSERFIQYARQNHPETLYDFKVGSALDLPVENDSFDVVVSGLALNFFPEPDTALREMHRAARPGGVIALYVWDYGNGMEMLRYFWDAVAVLDPEVTNLDQGKRFSICNPEPLRTLFTGYGLQSVVVQSIEIEAVFQNFDDYWQPFLGGSGSAPTYVATLNQDKKDALSNYLQNQLPVYPDGTIHLINRAWMVSGIK
jgi:ubiquinone/menaquinone biosynthesis C-methylase UbiE